MTAILTISGSWPYTAVLRCRVAACAGVRASTEAIGQWRRQAVTVLGETLSASFLKHAEDQTVVAFQAVLRALGQQAWPAPAFRDWGVVAAPTFFGRTTMAQTMERFRREGAW